MKGPRYGGAKSRPVAPVSSASSCLARRRAASCAASHAAKVFSIIFSHALMPLAVLSASGLSAPRTCTHKHGAV